MQNKSSLSKLCLVFTAAAALSGCAANSKMSPLNSKQETHLFTDSAKQKECLGNIAACGSTDRIPIGTAKADVFKILGMNPQAFSTLASKDIQVEIYGNALHVPFDQRDAAQALMNALEGKTATHSDVTSHRKFGLTSMQVDTDGISVTFNLVFKDGKLFNPVNVRQNAVTGSKREGYFSNFGAGSVLGLF